MNPRNVADAVELMTRFADRTGLTSSRPARRYLWTDAFAVCNFLSLAHVTGDRGYAELASRLTDQVHRELGRHRPDDHRSGWLSGLSESEGAAHPTRGGLRIGKRFAERAENEPFDSDLEWERDGQYFHYLTKWMHALDQVAGATSNATLHEWARDLADVAHRAFTHGRPRSRRMTWKLSVDLSRPLVPSMGQHDPLDGLVTCTVLDASARELQAPKRPDLSAAASDFAAMIDPDRLSTDDALGIGGLLFDAFRLAQAEPSHALIGSILSATLTGLRGYTRASDLRAPAHRRLAFRELGLAIGLAAVPPLGGERFAGRLGTFVTERVADLAEYVPLANEIKSFWLDPAHRRSRTWNEHTDINDVMLATSLVPAGFLVLQSPLAASAAPSIHDAAFPC